MRPNENKFKPLEVDASHMAQGNTENLVQGHTDVLIQRHGSHLSLQKQGSGSNRIEESSYN